MAPIKKYLKILIGLVLVILILITIVDNYGLIFARHVIGKIEKVETVQLNLALMQGLAPGEKISPQLFNFAVAIKEPSGEIVTAIAEDRQWAVAQKGQCAEAKFYPYPPWRFDKTGTYYGARLIKLSDCN